MTDVPHGVAAYTHDFPPGTEMVDPNGKEEHIHYPLPDPVLTDPLNWSRKWKHLTFFTAVWFVFFTTVPLLALSSIYPTLMMEFNITPAQISQSSSWVGLIVALWCFIVLPACNLWGRRATLFWSNLIVIAGNVWFTNSHSYTHFFWSRNLAGVGSAMIEVLAITQVGDMFFTSEAGLYHALGLAPLIIASSVGSPVVAGFVQAGAGWRAFMWMCTAISIFTQFLIFFAFPETFWPRTADSARGIAASPTTAVRSTDSKADDAGEEEKASPAMEVLAATQTEVVGLVGTGAPSKKQRYGLFSTRNKAYNPLRQGWDVLVVTTFAPVLLADLWWTAIGGLAVGFGFVTSSIWSVPPYNFSISQVGCTNLPAVLGGLVGLVLCGPICDWDLQRRTRAAGGKREAEMRLWIGIYGGILTSICMVIYAVGETAVILIPGQTGFSFFSNFPVIAAINYATDTYKRYPLEISFSMTITKGLYTFMLGYVMNDLLAKRGALICMMLVSIPIFVAVPATLALAIWGKSLRRLSANTSLMQ